MTISTVALSAQDFATRFMASHKQDANVTCITISPTMMEKILKVDAVEKDDNMTDVISNLKSMQLLTSQVKVLHYYNDAMQIIEKNSDRFEPYLSFKGEKEECKIMIRKNKGVIVEMVMLSHKRHQFSVINLTGNMNQEFISKLANAMNQKRS